MSFKNLVLRAGAVALMMASVQVQALNPFSATYQFSYNGKTVGDATRTLSQQAENQWQYQFSAKIPMLGQAVETSRFSVNNGQIQSQNYQRQTKILVHRDTVSLDFMPQQKKIISKRKGETRQLAWRAGVLDDLNAELQVREDLKKSTLKSSYTIASHRDVDQRQFVREGTERVQAANGQVYETIRVRLKHASPSKQTVFWLAPSMDYLPIKVTHKDDKASFALLFKKS